MFAWKFCMPPRLGVACSEARFALPSAGSSARRQRALSASPAGATRRGCDSAACWSPAALGGASRAAANTLPGALQCGRLAKQQFRAPWDLSVVITTTSSHLCSLRPHLASPMGPAARAATLVLPGLQTGLLGLVPASPRPAWAWRARQGRGRALRAPAQPLRSGQQHSLCLGCWHANRRLHYSRFPACALAGFPSV